MCCIINSCQQKRTYHVDFMKTSNIKSKVEAFILPSKNPSSNAQSDSYEGGEQY